ncbi:hypothetical protein [Streptomyces sp. NPDC002209]|uniref:hypothetical protein n=1 Tax=Streptomyces sp. NPDC002209 TaxID=3364638 RepID=UPI0036A8DD8E
MSAFLHRSGFSLLCKRVLFVREQMAVRTDWKPDVSPLQCHRISDGDPILVQESIIGPQIDPKLGHLPGGGTQIEIMEFEDRARLIPVGPTGGDPPVTAEEPDVVVDWAEGDTTVRWSGPAGDVETTYTLPPQAVMTWREYDETLVLVVEAVNSAPFTPSDNAVVYRADGTERFRLHPPRDLLSNPDDVHGFYDAFPQDGRPLMIMVTRNAGDFHGRIDLETGEIVDTNTWR